MIASDPSEVVGFDADAAVEAARSSAGDAVHLCVEYDSEEFNTLYADDVTLSMYGGRDEMANHFEQVHSYVHVDFTEQDLFSEVFRGAGGVRSFVTYMDHVTLVRLLVGREGLFLTLDSDGRVTETIEAMEDAISDR